MSWARFDDGFHLHPKTIAMSDKAFRLYSCSITYSQRERLMGRLTKPHVGVLLRITRAAQRHVDELVSVRGWDLDGDSYVIHNYARYNDPEDVRRKRAEAGRIGGLRSGEVRSKESNGEAFASHNPSDAKQTGSKTEAQGIPNPLYPNPESQKTPSTKTDSKQKECAAGAACARTFDLFWSHYPRKENKRKAREWWMRHKPDSALVKKIAEGLRHAKLSKQWADGVIPHAITWLNGERWNDQYEERSAPGNGIARAEAVNPSLQDVMARELAAVRGGKA